MFKIEVVAETPEQMAGKLTTLAEIYSEGARYQKHRGAVDKRETSGATGAEAETEEVNPPKKPSGRKPKQQTVDAAAEPEPKSDKPLTIDDVRKSWMAFVDAAAVKSGKEETRREEFKALLAVFGAAKMGEIPEDKWAEAIELGEKKLAEIS